MKKEGNIPMTQSSPPTEPPEISDVATPQPSYVKLAMRNMVRKKGTSIKHYFLTLVGLLGALIGLAYLTR